MEFQESNNSGEATANIQALINALTEDAQNGSKEAEEFLQKLQGNAKFLNGEESWIKFVSCTEMYDYLTSGNDLYNTKTGDYVFTYNDAYALCVYNLEKAEAKELVRAVKKSDDDYWGAFLGPGGTILDDCRFDKFRFSKDENLRAMYLQPSFDYFDTPTALAVGVSRESTGTCVGFIAKAWQPRYVPEPYHNQEESQ